MAHRIREAIREGSLLPPMGGSGKIMEANETYNGRRKSKKPKRGTVHKRPILTLAEREGTARPFQIDTATIKTVTRILKGEHQSRNHSHDR